jgi:hypothetical protein
MKITNTSDGPRGFHSAAGLVTLEKGETWDGDISDAEVKSARDTGYFDVGGHAKAAPKGDDAKA